jgi:uncharacterized SAM-binding protein YcdF (DUF218 family)
VKRRVVLIVAAVAALFALYVVVTFGQVWYASHQDEARRAEAIVVLGAAQFNGKPSKVLQARLDHAADLYKQGLAPLIVVTGGKQPGDNFTEAEASANYLSQHGVPGGAIERETTSSNSYDELAATARFLHQRGIDDVVLVSDPFHAYRINAIAHDVGLNAHVSPTPSSPVHGVDNAEALMRETVAVAAGRLVGFDRLDRWLGR